MRCCQLNKTVPDSVHVSSSSEVDQHMERPYCNALCIVPRPRSLLQSGEDTLLPQCAICKLLVSVMGPAQHIHQMLPHWNFETTLKRLCYFQQQSD